VTAKQRKRADSSLPGKTHIVIPDVQAKPGVPLDHLKWIGQYVADKKPDELICLGDFWDMPSLSSYDKGKKSFEGRRFKADVEAGRKAMDLLMTPIKKMRRPPRLAFCLGNHEERIHRAIEQDAVLEGTIGYQDLGLAQYGWRVFDFLQPISIDGVRYCHFFPQGPTGLITQTKRGSPSAIVQLQRLGQSSVAGHQQGLSISNRPFRGILQWGIIAGSCYLHDEDYLSPMGNTHWRGILILHQVKDGAMSPTPVDLEYLAWRYARKPLSTFRPKTPNR
jgi:hypothetical protein